MGKYFVTAFINRDYFLVTAVVVVFSAILTASNLLVEVLNPLVNPKLRQ
jgi:ABC-type dipeptide/oligopeptide/nickel transport system permease component